MPLSENYECDGQLSIFDLFRQEPSEDELPELEQIIPMIENKYGLKFITEDISWLGSGGKRIEYKSKYKGLQIAIHDSKYSISGKRFVSTSCFLKMCGHSVSCDNIKQIYQTINYGFRLLGKTDVKKGVYPVP